jgi:hypothetical protein
MFYFEGYTSHTKVSWSRIILIRVYHIIFCAAKQRQSCTFTSFPPNEHHRVQVLPVTRRRLWRGKEDLVFNYKLLLSLSLWFLQAQSKAKEWQINKNPRRVHWINYPIRTTTSQSLLQTPPIPPLARSVTLCKLRPAVTVAKTPPIRMDLVRTSQLFFKICLHYSLFHSELVVISIIKLFNL